jgi:hypothetical protein
LPLLDSSVALTGKCRPSDACSEAVALGLVFDAAAAASPPVSGTCSEGLFFLMKAVTSEKNTSAQPSSIQHKWVPPGIITFLQSLGAEVSFSSENRKSFSPQIYNTGPLSLLFFLKKMACQSMVSHNLMEITEV